MQNPDCSEQRTRVRRLVSATALGLLTLLTTLALGVSQAGAEPAATPTASGQQVVTLTANQAREFAQQVDGMVTSAAPAGLGCLPEFPPPCGIILSRSLTQTLWKNVVNKPISAVAAYCRTLLRNLGAGGLTWICDAAANLLRNLTAPNGRCLFIGAKVGPIGIQWVVKYTTFLCS